MANPLTNRGLRRIIPRLAAIVARGEQSLARLSLPLEEVTGLALPISSMPVMAGAPRSASHCTDCEGDELGIKNAV